MSHRFLSWTLFLLASSPALARSGTEIIDLPHCGGQAVIYRNERQTVVKLDDVDDCSNVTVDGQRMKMQQQRNERYAFVYTWQPTIYRDQLILRVHSNSSRTEDEVRVASSEEGWNRRPNWERPVSWRQPPPPVVTTVRDEDMIYLDESRNSALLPECGGRVRMDLERHRLVVRIEGPNTCDRVRLTVFNQQPLLMESVRRVDRDCGVWTFALPERAVRPGRNSLTLAIAGRHNRSDVVRYYFSDRRWFFASGGR